MLLCDAFPVCSARAGRPARALLHRLRISTFSSSTKLNAASKCHTSTYIDPMRRRGRENGDSNGGGATNARHAQSGCGANALTSVDGMALSLALPPSLYPFLPLVRASFAWCPPCANAIISGRLHAALCICSAFTWCPCHHEAAHAWGVWVCMEQHGVCGCAWRRLGVWLMAYGAGGPPRADTCHRPTLPRTALPPSPHCPQPLSRAGTWYVLMKF
jgi:hypothetical protein